MFNSKIITICKTAFIKKKRIKKAPTRNTEDSQFSLYSIETSRLFEEATMDRTKSYVFFKSNSIVHLKQCQGEASPLLRKSAVV